MRAVDHHQVRSGHVEPPSRRPRRVPHHRRVLGVALRDGDWVLGADRIDAERHYTQVVDEVDAVDDERGEAELMEVTGEQFVKGMLDPP
jgi:hypothetical protein